MSAKVFADSSDVIEDQSKILSEYLISAAKKIVEEELRIEGEIEAKKKERSANRKLAKTQQLVMICCFAGAAVGLGLWVFTKLPILGILAFVLTIVATMALFSKNKYKLQ